MLRETLTEKMAKCKTMRPSIIGIRVITHIRTVSFILCLFKFCKKFSESVFKQWSVLPSPALVGRERLVIALWFRSLSCGDERRIYNQTCSGPFTARALPLSNKFVALSPSRPCTPFLLLGASLSLASACYFL